MKQLLHELPNGIKLKILGHKKVPTKPMKYLDLMGSMQAPTQKANFNICARNLRKICCEYHVEKPILLNFEDFYTIFCPRL